MEVGDHAHHNHCRSRRVAHAHASCVRHASSQHRAADRYSCIGSLLWDANPDADSHPHHGAHGDSHRRAHGNTERDGGDIPLYAGLRLISGSLRERSGALGGQCRDCSHDGGKADGSVQHRRLFRRIRMVRVRHSAHSSAEHVPPRHGSVHIRQQFPGTVSYSGGRTNRLSLHFLLRGRAGERLHRRYGPVGAHRYCRLRYP